MRNFLFRSIFIIFIFSCANIFNLFSDDAGGMDFLDQLLKEIETMEKTSEGSKMPKYDDNFRPPVKYDAEPSSRMFDDKEESTIRPKSEIKKKDRRTLFIDPDVQQVKGSGKNTKIRPTKESIDALNFYSNEFNETSYSVENKITNNPTLKPQFKEFNFIQFKNELEQANSLLDIIRDKGIYTALFLKPEKQEPASPTKNIRKDFLDILKKLKDLDSELGEPEEEQEPDVDALQTLASQEPKQALPEYEPLAAKKQTPPTEIIKAEIEPLTNPTKETEAKSEDSENETLEGK